MVTKSNSNSKVFGISLSKQSTKSLNKAFQILGLNTYHCPDINTLFDKNNDGGTDIPCVAYLEPLLQVFPNSKLIAIQRPVDDWLRSCEKHFKKTRNAYFLQLRNIVYGCDEYDEKLFIQAYRRHQILIGQLQSQRPKNILTLDISDGSAIKWLKIANFLGKPTPSVNFPHLKS